MFESKTLFVLGAGASVEFGLPTGQGLKKSIMDALDFRFERGIPTAGNLNIFESIQLLASKKSPPEKGDMRPYLRSASEIRRGLPLQASIDNYIAVHSADSRIVEVGKLAIAACLLEAEERSKLYFDLSFSSSLNFEKLEQTWIVSLFKILTSDIKANEPDSAFKNVDIICFNYDRCVEHFFRYALQTVCKLSDGDAESVARKLVVLHPYGQIGHLPWQLDHHVVGFGHHNIYDPTSLSTAASNLRVFTEQTIDPRVIEPMSDLVQNADTIVFLGFAFHRQNLKLIAPASKSRATRVFATTYKMSDSDKLAVSSELCQWLKKDSRDVELSLYNGTCFELFETYSRSLTRAVTS